MQLLKQLITGLLTTLGSACILFAAKYYLNNLEIILASIVITSALLFTHAWREYPQLAPPAGVEAGTSKFQLVFQLFASFAIVIGVLSAVFIALTLFLAKYLGTDHMIMVASVCFGLSGNAFNHLGRYPRRTSGK